MAAVGLAVHLPLRIGGSPASSWPLIAVLVLGGVPLLASLWAQAVAGRFSSDFLAGMSIATAALLGEYLAGAIVVLMLAGGAVLEQYATRRASAVLSALSGRMPRVAHRHTAGAIEDIGIDSLRLGDVVTVLPHEICPVDGRVVEGRGSMDESYLTGEPYQISKTPGAAVLSGAVNGESAMKVAVTALPEDSRYAKITRVMREAEENRPRFRRIADRLGAWYTLAALAVAVGGWTVSGDPARFLAVLVIATPCPLLIAIPVAIIGAISTAARRGIVVKDAIVLEQIDMCKTIIFDKTGTLTYGRPALREVVTAEGVTREAALRLAAGLEQYSKHPLAPAIVETARRERITPAPVTEIAERPGEGLSGIIAGRRVQVGGRGGVEGVPPPAGAGLECVLSVDGEFAALLRFVDEPREESHSFVQHLAPKHGVDRVVLLSGDREDSVRDLAAHVGIAEVLYGKSPEEKVAVVREAAARGPTLFLGDGINDAPAMQAATVGIAFGHKSDVTSEAAGAVVLEASLSRVDELIHIGRRMRQIAMQSAVGGMALSVVGMFAAAAGYLPPVAGAVAQEIIDVLAVANALRMVWSGELRET